MAKIFSKILFIHCLILINPLYPTLTDVATISRIFLRGYFASSTTNLHQLSSNLQLQGSSILTTQEKELLFNLAFFAKTSKGKFLLDMQNISPLEKKELREDVTHFSRELSLFHAISAKDTETVKKLLEKDKVSPNYTGIYGFDPLSWSLWLCDNTTDEEATNEISTLLIKHGADVSHKNSYCGYETPFHLAAYKKLYTIFDAIVETNKKSLPKLFSMKNGKNQTVLDIFLSHYKYSLKEKRKLFEYIRLCIQQGIALDPDAFLQMPGAIEAWQEAKKADISADERNLFYQAMIFPSWQKYSKRKEYAMLGFLLTLNLALWSGVYSMYGVYQGSSSPTAYPLLTNTHHPYHLTSNMAKACTENPLIWIGSGLSLLSLIVARHYKNNQTELEKKADS